MSDNAALIESAIGGNKEDLRTLLLQYNAQLTLHNQTTGTNWVDPTSGVQKASTTPPPLASAEVSGANGVFTAQVTNPSQAANATIYHEFSYSPVKNFSQNVTTLPVTAQTQITIPNPGATLFVRYRSSYDKQHWNSHQLASNSSIAAGLQSSAASEPATALNNWNFATVKGSGAPGQVPLIQVYGPNGPYSGYPAGRGTTQFNRPSATILNTDFTQSQIVAFDGKQFQVGTTLPAVMKDSWEPVGQALVNGALGGGGPLGTNGARLTAI